MVPLAAGGSTCGAVLGSRGRLVQPRHAATACAKGQVEGGGIFRNLHLECELPQIIHRFWLWAPLACLPSQLSTRSCRFQFKSFKTFCGVRLLDGDQRAQIYSQNLQRPSPKQIRLAVPNATVFNYGGSLTNFGRSQPFTPWKQT